MQGWICWQIFSFVNEKILCCFLSWEVVELIFCMNQLIFCGKLVVELNFFFGEVEEDGCQCWFLFEEVNELCCRIKVNCKMLMLFCFEGKCVFCVVIVNFKGGVGKLIVVLYFVYVVVLDGYWVLVVDFDLQVMLSYLMGLIDVGEDYIVWGIMVCDLEWEIDWMNVVILGVELGIVLFWCKLFVLICDMGLGILWFVDFIKFIVWFMIDIVFSCVNVVFVEFVSVQYWYLNLEWIFFGVVLCFLDSFVDDVYDLILFDCLLVIGYQLMNVVFVVDMLYIFLGFGYWEYDLIISFIGQLFEVLEDLLYGFENFFMGKICLFKVFVDICFLMMCYEFLNELYQVMFGVFWQVFGDCLVEYLIELICVVEQLGCFLFLIYEIDYCEMMCGIWWCVCVIFDQVYEEFCNYVIVVWMMLEDEV